MPPSTFSGLSQAAHNHRSSGSFRQRENHQQNAAGTSGRRRKSRSPSGRAPEEPLSRNGSFIVRKARKPAATTNEVPTRGSVYGDATTNPDRRAKVKPARTQSVFVEEDNIIPASRELARGRGVVPNNKSKRKDKSRSRSRDASQHASRKTASPEPRDDDSESQRSTYCGPLAMADFSRMRHELEILKREKSQSKKTIIKQSKVIDELRKELSGLKKAESDKAKEVEIMRKQAKKVDDVVANFEATLTCPICTDVLTKPHGLSPCGHVLCQSCLQEWFRSAPVDDDDMYDDEDPPSLIYRKKTCPSCRAAIRSRPIPLFLVKAIVADVEKAKAPANAPRHPSPPREDDSDPWSDIFPDDLGGGWYADADEHDEDDEEDVDDDYDDDDDDDNWSFDGYGTGEDEERYEGIYEHARWQPPRVYVEQDNFAFMDDMDAADLAMLRRGATLQMIDLFSMSYSHATGLKALVDEYTTVYLGWNIDLHPEDESGEEFMDWIARDMVERPERWEVMEDLLGNRTAWKLVPEEEDEDDYYTSDSEAWAADMMSD